MTEIGFALVALDDVPAEDAWLGPHERAALRRHATPVRRAQWRLGRWAARQAVGATTAFDARTLEIIAARDGAPEAWDARGPMPVSVSISHRATLAAAIAAAGDVTVGCDVELIEPRPRGFADDWFTQNECRAVEHAAPDERDALITLIWSAKEAVLKALRQGLRRDTRDVDVSPGDGTFEARVDGNVVPGWWKRDGPYVITAAALERKS